MSTLFQVLSTQEPDEPHLSVGVLKMQRRDFLKAILGGAVLAPLAATPMLIPGCSKPPTVPNTDIVKADLESRIGGKYDIHVFAQLTDYIHGEKPEIAYVHNGALLLYRGRIEFCDFRGSRQTLQAYSQEYKQPCMMAARSLDGMVALYVINGGNGHHSIVRLDITTGQTCSSVRKAEFWKSDREKSISILGIVRERYLVMQRDLEPQYCIIDLDHQQSSGFHFKWVSYDHGTTDKDQIIEAAIEMNLLVYGVRPHGGFAAVVGSPQDMVALYFINTGSTRGQYLVRLISKSSATQPGGK